MSVDGDVAAIDRAARLLDTVADELERDIRALSARGPIGPGRLALELVLRGWVRP